MICILTLCFSLTIYYNISSNDGSRTLLLREVPLVQIPSLTTTIPGQPPLCNYPLGQYPLANLSLRAITPEDSYPHGWDIYPVGQLFNSLTDKWNIINQMMNLTITLPLPLPLRTNSNHNLKEYTTWCLVLTAGTPGRSSCLYHLLPSIYGPGHRSTVLHV